MAIGEINFTYKPKQNVPSRSLTAAIVATGKPDFVKTFCNTSLSILLNPSVHKV